MSRWWCLLLVAAVARAGEVLPLAADVGEERLRAGGFEGAGWNAYEGGFTLAPGAGRDGSQAAHCGRAQATAPARGVSQSLRLDQTRPCPLLVTGWSKAQGVDGHADPDYSLYCDLHYTDGTPLWGQSAAFEVGTHDWQRVKVVIWPARPVRSLTVYGLFRRHLGTVWFDDFSVRELTASDGLARLDGVSVTPTCQPTRSGLRRLVAGDLALELSGHEISRVVLGGTPVGGRSAGGFLVRDVAADTGFHDFDGERCAALGLRLTTRWVERGTHLEVSGELRSETAANRAVTLLCALPVAAGGRRWGQDMDESAPTDSAPELANLVRVEAGSNGLLSRYPLANVSGPDGGLSMALDAEWRYPDAPAGQIRFRPVQ
jgi:hypothetical protein